MVGDKAFQRADIDLSASNDSIDFQTRASSESRERLLVDSQTGRQSVQSKSSAEALQLPELTLAAVDRTGGAVEKTAAALDKIVPAVGDRSLPAGISDSKDSADNKANAYMDRIVQIVSSNEGSFTTLTPNDAGHGISVGILQWNQRVGQLPGLLRAWHARDPQDFKAIFGPYSSKLLNEHWVRTHDMASDRPLMQDFRKALRNSKFQDIQMDLARDFVKDSMDVGYGHGFRSELGLALVCDMVNQMGKGGFERAFRKSHLGHVSIPDHEKEAISKLNKAVRRPNGHFRYTTLSAEFSPIETAAL
jgi:hypothetical protein